MWSIFKGVIGLLVAGALAYLLFFVQLGDKTIAGHVGDVWRSPAMQEKVHLAREGVRRQIEDRLAEVAEKATRQAVRDTTGSHPGADFEQQDREALIDVLEGR